MNLNYGSYFLSIVFQVSYVEGYNYSIFDLKLNHPYIFCNISLLHVYALMMIGSDGELQTRVWEHFVWQVALWHTSPCVIYIYACILWENIVYTIYTYMTYKAQTTQAAEAE